MGAHIRELKVSDSEKFESFAKYNDSLVDLGTCKAKSTIKFLIKSYAKEYEDNMYGIENTEGELVGLLDTYRIGKDAIEIGVWVESKHRRKGYGREAVRDAMNKFKGGIAANIECSNKASLKMIENIPEATS